MCSTAAYTIMLLDKSCSCWVTTAAYTVMRLAKPSSTATTNIVVRLPKSCAKMSS
jgi:hypothetical protein